MLAGIAAGGGAGLFFGGGWADVLVSAVLGTIVGFLGGVFEGQRTLDKVYEVSTGVVSVNLSLMHLFMSPVVLFLVHRSGPRCFHCSHADSLWCASVLLRYNSLLLHVFASRSHRKDHLLII